MLPCVEALPRLDFPQLAHVVCRAGHEFIAGDCERLPLRSELRWTLRGSAVDGQGMQGHTGTCRPRKNVEISQHGCAAHAEWQGLSTGRYNAQLWHREELTVDVDTPHGATVTLVCAYPLPIVSIEDARRNNCLEKFCSTFQWQTSVA